ncbi:DNA dC-_dU-editing enzyme APOBEC3-like [Dendropsophus ebraccatus]|uniref:DNA dC->dU-editing enzyme APOBEC3-like n=1 Tax=Dendropsophus ebraccatus TaxID=150705 RepID=UPI0038314AD5
MTLFIRKFLSEEEFNDNFNTVDLVKKTLVCFSLGGKKPLWKLWGYAYNNPRVEHAEIIVLRELSKFLGSNLTKRDPQYKITLYASYSPCLNCSEEICKFLIDSKEKLIINLHISKFYNFHDYDNKISLIFLRKFGVQIKMMDLEEYKACFYLFVDPEKQFNPCEELDIQCERNGIELDHLWSEDLKDNLGLEDNLFRRKRQNSVYFDFEGFSPSHNKDAFIRLQKDITTPKKNEQEKESKAKTPVKIPPLKDIDHKETLKRKLTFD